MTQVNIRGNRTIYNIPIYYEFADRWDFASQIPKTEANDFRWHLSDNPWVS